MSRKINSNLLKKNKYNKWVLNYLTKTKEEMSFFVLRNYVILNVLKTLFIKSKLLILNCKLHKTSSLIQIYLSYVNIKPKKQKTFNDKNKIETSLFINKILKVLNEYTKNKLNFYIIIQNVKKYLIQLKLFSTYNIVKKKNVCKNEKI